MSNRNDSTITAFETPAPAGEFTLKGRVGIWEYGYTGPNQWIVRDRYDHKHVVGQARNLNDAFNLARRAYEREE